jgi:hypothetical protein
MRRIVDGDGRRGMCIRLPNSCKVGKRRNVVAIIAIVVVSLSALEAAPARARAECERPQPKLRYTPGEIIVSLTVDLAACRWWTGSGIQLDGVLQQQIGEATAVSRFCGVAEWAGGRPPAARQRVTRCRLRLRLDHLPVEVQGYEGNFTYPWRGRDETVEFAYLCVSTAVLAQCRQN